MMIPCKYSYGSGLVNSFGRITLYAIHILSVNSRLLVSVTAQLQTLHTR